MKRSIYVGAGTVGSVEDETDEGGAGGLTFEAMLVISLLGLEQGNQKPSKIPIDLPDLNQRLNKSGGKI